MIEFMVQDLVAMLSESQDIEFDIAMQNLYASKVYDRLTDEETGLYRESSGYVFGLLQDELGCGYLPQAEI